MVGHERDTCVPGRVRMEDPMVAVRGSVLYQTTGSVCDTINGCIVSDRERIPCCMAVCNLNKAKKEKKPKQFLHDVINSTMIKRARRKEKRVVL